MVFASRKVVFPFFIIVFSIAFVSIVYLAFLDEALAVYDPVFSVSGDQVVLKMTIANNSNHIIDDIRVVVKSQSTEKTFFLNNDISNSSLGAWQKYPFVARVPLSDDRDFTVTVSAPFNRELTLAGTLSESTINPVKAKVSLSQTLVANRVYDYSVELCNVTSTDLSAVWFGEAEPGLVKEEFFETPREITLAGQECKTVPYTITITRDGSATLWFHLKVGEMERRQEFDVNVIPGGAG